KELEELAERAGDTNVHREDEPCRRALIGIYSRLSATLRALTAQEALRQAMGHETAYADSQEFLGDLRIVEDSL
ncbi:phosphoenolpyruvate carboxylase, partial [Acinetobacter baumannii]|uniref:phosphoenolpyruvate carboxylase n=1 Tax=Acinetobacter baumannii TaxID=470 RepID=UPI00111242B8